MYKLTYESDDEQLVADLSTKKRGYKSTDVKRSRSMATQDPTSVPEYLTQESELSKPVRADSTASVVMSAYPAKPASTSSPNKKGSLTSSSKPEKRKKVFPSNFNDDTANILKKLKKDKSCCSFSSLRNALLLLYLLLVTVSLVFSLFAWQVNFKRTSQLESKIDALQELVSEKLERLEKAQERNQHEQFFLSKSLEGGNEGEERRISMEEELETIKAGRLVESAVIRRADERSELMEGRISNLESLLDDMARKVESNEMTMRSLTQQELAVEELLLEQLNDHLER